MAMGKTKDIKPGEGKIMKDPSRQKRPIKGRPGKPGKPGMKPLPIKKPIKKPGDGMMYIPENPRPPRERSRIDDLSNQLTDYKTY